MDVTVSEMMTNFLNSPLVSWVKTFGPLSASPEDNLSMFMELVDGVFLHNIMMHIDPSPMNQRVNKHVNNDVNLRVQNLSIVTRHIKTYYQECLQQLVVMNLPNVLTISKDPLSEKAMEEMKRLLLLILGCAVQCERKEEFIEKIKLLDIETQAVIVAHIQEVTHNQENVLDLQWLELADLPPEELDTLSRTMAFHLRRLIDERDDCAEVMVELTQERDYLLSQQPSSALPVREVPEPPSKDSAITLLCREDRQHLAVELADSKAKLRRTRQQLEEKTEQLIDIKNEVERLEAEVKKLKQENVQLLAEARSVRLYRDELDALRERAGRADRLETELARCKERLHDVPFYRARVEELREDNMTLLETKALLEEQLAGARGRCDRLHDIEKENLQLRSKLHDMEMDRDVDKKRLEELLEENMLLEISQKQSMNESAQLGWELEQLSQSSDVSKVCKSVGLELQESASSKLLRLEKENQALQRTIQEQQEVSMRMQERELRITELEKENQSLSKKLEGLQMVVEQEKQTTQDMESLGEELLKEKQKLERLLEAVQTEKCRQISELMVEKEHLTQTVAGLRQRAQAEGEARVRQVEEENRALHHSVSEGGAKLGRLEAEQGRLREQLQKQSAALQGAREHAEALLREKSALEQDNGRLKKLADAAQNTALRLESLQGESLELRRELESLRPAAAKAAELQKQVGELEREREELGRAAEELRALGKKAERLEVSCRAFDSENQHLRQALEQHGERVQGLEQELRDVEAENEQVRRELEERRIAERRLEAREQERQALEQELAQLAKEGKRLEKDVRRLQQQVEAKDSALDEGTLRLACLEKEGRLRDKELVQLRDATAKMKELESENKELQKQATMDKRTLATLREDLVNEKLKGQQQWNELQKLSQELEKMGLNRERLLQQEHSAEDSKYKMLETKIEVTLKKTLEIREEKIQSLESRLKESSSLNLQLRAELCAVKKNLEALKQRQEEEEAHARSDENGEALGSTAPHTNQDKLVQEREATAELLRLKDRLIDVEKNNAALETEKQLQREQLRQLDTQNSQLSAQLLALQRQVAALQEHNTALHMQTAKLQVESSTLGSQSASLLAQNAALQAQVQALEGEAEAARRQREEARAGREAALHEHERLLALHERQAAEYEQLIGQHAGLKGSLRLLEQEHRALDTKYSSLLTQRSTVEELETALRHERENLREELHKNVLVQGENQSLRADMERMTQVHGHLQQEYDGLQLHTKELKTSLNEVQLELNGWQARYDQLKEQHQGLDISFTKLESHCELLTRLKGNLEEENHHLMRQVQILGQRNQTLLEQSMESKELYYEEQKQYIDKLNTLRRQKEKLEEKIMDQYKFYDPIPKKRNHWVGAKALVKLMKPKKENSQELLQSVPDSSPCPSSPPSSCSDGLSPALPHRQSRLSVGSVGSHSLEENHALSPTLTSNHSAKVSHDSTGTRGWEQCRTPRASVESVSHLEDTSTKRTTVTPGSSSGNHSTPGCYSQEPMACDDIIALRQERRPNASVAPCGRPHSSSAPSPPCDALQHKGAARQPRPRPSSPGSEMVTLEEFLQEANAPAPLTVKASSQEDLMMDCFGKVVDCPGAGHSMSLREGTKTPTSYVMPTVKAVALGDHREGRASKPGQSVKPSVRTPEMGVPLRQVQTLPNRVGGGAGLRPSSLQSQDPRGNGGTLSRTFSLASADLLHSSGPESYKKEGVELSPVDMILRRTRAGVQDRPQSARLLGSSASPVDVSCRPLDPRRLSLAPPGDSYSLESVLPPPQHHSSSLSLCISPSYGARQAGVEQHPPGRHRNPQTPQHHAEVAMVTPVRAVMALKEEEEKEEWQEAQQMSSPQLKRQETGGGHGGTEKEPKSSPPPQEPNEDPQTVWYEYGCV